MLLELFLKLSHASPQEQHMRITFYVPACPSNHQQLTYGATDGKAVYCLLRWSALLAAVLVRLLLISPEGQ